MQAGFRIEGSVALVTGAAGGIGRHLVEGLLAGGAAKVYAATRGGDAQGLDARVAPVRLDITDDAQIAQAAARCGDVTLLINNAGVNRNLSFLEAPSLDAARSEMEANYFGTLRMCRAFAPVLARVPGSTIVNVVSMAANRALPAMGSRCALEGRGTAPHRVPEAGARGARHARDGLPAGPGGHGHDEPSRWRSQAEPAGRRARAARRTRGRRGNRHPRAGPALSCRLTSS